MHNHFFLRIYPHHAIKIRVQSAKGSPSRDGLYLNDENPGPRLHVVNQAPPPLALKTWKSRWPVSAITSLAFRDL